MILNILFIVSFLLEFETETVNRMNFAIQKEIDELFVYFQMPRTQLISPYSTEPLLYLKDASTMSDVSFFLKHVIFDHVLDSGRIYTPTNYENTL